MSQSRCSTVAAISDRQSKRLQNRFDLIQIICYIKFMFTNIYKNWFACFGFATKTNGEHGSPLRNNSNFATFIKIVYDTNFQSLLTGVR